jgi:hypothetical protein
MEVTLAIRVNAGLRRAVIFAIGLGAKLNSKFTAINNSLR